MRTKQTNKAAMSATSPKRMSNTMASACRKGAGEPREGGILACGVRLQARLAAARKRPSTAMAHAAPPRNASIKSGKTSASVMLVIRAVTKMLSL